MEIAENIGRPEWIRTIDLFRVKDGDIHSARQLNQQLTRKKEPISAQQLERNGT
jgi:hypothetical protein